MQRIIEYIKKIEGIDSITYEGLLRYFSGIIDIFDDDELVKNNLLNQLKLHFNGVEIVEFDNDDYGRQSPIYKKIQLSNKLKEHNYLNTLLHELTHSLAVNSIVDEVIYEKNRGLKGGEVDTFWWGIDKEWVTDENYYGFDDGKSLNMLDEWLTEWIANLYSNLNYAELKTDENGNFRLKTTDAYDGSNIMNLMNLVYGKKELINLLLGLTYNEEQRKSVIPMYGFHRMNEMYENVLTEEEKNSISSKYVTNPNNTILLMNYISEYTISDKKTDSLIKMMNLLTRQYVIKIKNELASCNNENEINNLYHDILLLQKSIIWNFDLEKMKEFEYYQNYENIIKMFLNKINELGFEFDKSLIEKSPENIFNEFEVLQNESNYNNAKML